MKTWMKVALAIVAAIAALLGVIFWLTGDITKTGDDFFDAVQNDDIDSAYALLSSDFQAGTSKQQLQTFLESYGLDEVTDTSWSGRSISGSTGELNGTVETVQGESIPVKLELVKGNNGWKIYSIVKQKPGFQSRSDASVPPTPSQEELIALVSQTTSDFVDGLNAPTMAGFHKTMAPQFQREASVEKLEKAFSQFRGEKRMEVFKTLRPGMTMPVNVQDNGILIIEGSYNTRPTKLNYRYSYGYIGSSWKLMGIAVDAAPVE